MSSLCLLGRKQKSKKRQWFHVADGVQEVEQDGLEMQEAMELQVVEHEPMEVVQVVNEVTEDVQVVEHVVDEVTEEVQVVDEAMEVQVTPTKVSSMLSARSLHKKIHSI
jgi:uncharacterized protein YoxC